MTRCRHRDPDEQPGHQHIREHRRTQAHPRERTCHAHRGSDNLRETAVGELQHHPSGGGKGHEDRQRAAPNRASSTGLPAARTQPRV